MYPFESEERLQCIDETIQIVEKSLQTRDNIIIGKLLLDKIDYYRLNTPQNHREEIENTAEESLKIFKEHKADNLTSKLEYYRAVSLLVKLEKNCEEKLFLEDAL